MNVARLVAVTFGVWWKSSARLVEGAAMRNAIAATTACGWLIWLFVATKANDGAVVNQGAATDQRLFESLAMLTTTAGWIVSAIATLYLPTRTVLDTVVAVLPLSQFERTLCDRLAPALLSLAACLAVLAPVVWPLLDSPLLDQSPPLSTIVLATTLALGTLLGQLTHLAVTAAQQRWFRRSSTRSAAERSAVLSVCLAMVVLGWSYTSVAEGDGPPAAIAVLTNAAADAGRGRPIGLLTMGLIVVAAAGLFAALSRLVATRFHAVSVDSTPTTLRTLVTQSPPTTMLTTLELVVWARQGYNRSTLVALLLGGAASLAWWVRQPGSSEVVLLASSLLGIASLVGASGYGGTRMWHWIYVAAGRPTRWVLPKLVATTSVWCGLIVPTAAVGVITGAWKPADTGVVISLSALQLVTVSIVGLLVPTSSGHSFQSLGNLFLSVVVSAVTLPLLLALPIAGDNGRALIGAGLLMCATCTLLYWQRARTDRSRPTITPA